MCLWCINIHKLIIRRGVDGNLWFKWANCSGIRFPLKSLVIQTLNFPCGDQSHPNYAIVGSPRDILDQIILCHIASTTCIFYFYEWLNTTLNTIISFQSFFDQNTLFGPLMEKKMEIKPNANHILILAVFIIWVKFILTHMFNLAQLYM